MRLVIKNKKMENQKNKAQSHVEVMVSFVIFIGFLLFIFIFLNPFARTKEPSYIMDNAQKVIIENISDEVGKLSIILTENGTCYNFPNDYGNNYKVVQEENKKYTVYFYPTFVGTKDTSCSKANYTLGTYSEEKFVVYDKIIELKNNYKDYDNLKKSLGITNDFLFKTKNIAGEEIPELSVSKSIPQGIDVESREIPIRAINRSTQIQELILNIRVW